MPDRFLEYTSLTPLEVLRLLATFAERAPDAAHRYVLEDVRLTVRIFDIGMPSVTLSIPYPVPVAAPTGGGGASENAIAIAPDLIEATALNLLRDIAREQGLQQISESSRQNATHTIYQVLPALLHSATMPGSSLLDNLAYVDDETLMIARDLKPSEARDYFEKLKRNASPVRVTIASAGEFRYFLFHVHHDERSFETFDSRVQADDFPACHLLRGFSGRYNQRDYRLFLPDDFQPDSRAIQFTVELMMQAPRLFQMGDEPPETAVLACVYPPEGDTHPPVFLNTRQLQFVDDWQVAPGKMYLHIGQVELQADKNDLIQLRKAIRQRADTDTELDIGYRITLESAHYQSSQDTTDEELNRLRGQMASLQARIFELENIRQPRPVLLRFSRDDLPALAEKVRSFQPHQLREILYAYHPAHEDTGDGTHFLFVPPRQETLYNPLVAYEDNAVQPVEFWLDPNWARFYDHLHSEENVYIFVPKGQMILPPMHSWQTGEMTDYLRSIMQMPHTEPIPNRPIYAIEAAESAHDTRLRVSILDYDAFQPINTPSVLGWLNDNLLVLQNMHAAKENIRAFFSNFIQQRSSVKLTDNEKEFLQRIFEYSAYTDLKTWITDLARDERRQTIARHLTRTADEAEAQLQERGKATADHLMQQLETLLITLQSEIERISSETADFMVQARDLNDRMIRLTAFYGVVSAEAEELDAELDRVPGSIKTLQRELIAMQKRVQKQTEEAEHKQQKYQDIVSDAVAAVVTTRRELEDELNRLRNGN